MWDSLQKIRYRANAGISSAQMEWEQRMKDRKLLSVTGIHGEEIYLTNVSELNRMAANLDLLYQQLPEHRINRETILIDAWSSATIEGARTTVEKIKECFLHPEDKDDRMVINAIKGSHYAYGRPITEKNIRRLWDIVVEDICENEASKGVKYRVDMVYIGSDTKTIHIPAAANQLPEMMLQYFAFCQNKDIHPIIRSFAAHFYFVYIHPFCDGNGRTARILNASLLYQEGYKKIKQVSLAAAINRQIGSYYNSLADSEIILNGQPSPWLDISPFVSYMMEIMEQSLINAALSVNLLEKSEQKILQRMDKTGMHAEITVKNAAKILKGSESGARAVLQKLVQKGYLSIDTTKKPYIYRLEQHIPSS